MKTYYIYNIATDEYLGKVEANSTISAERKACGIFTEIDSNLIAAFTEEF